MLDKIRLCRKGIITAFFFIITTVLVGAFSIDKTVSNKWQDYSYGNLEERMTNMNLPVECGSAMIFMSRENGKLVPLENYYETCHFDDIGYMLLGQIWVKFTGRKLKADTLANIHNCLFITGLIIISMEIIWVYVSYLSGMIAYILLMLLHSGIKPLLYSSVSQHSLLTVLPVLFVVILLPLIKFKSSNKWWTYLYVFYSGVCSGIFFLIRNPFGKGMLIVLAIILMIDVRKKNIKKPAIKLFSLISGFLFVTVLCTGLIGVLRDHEQGWSKPDLMEYFKLPSSHTTYYTLMAAIGRYENPLEMKYSDGILDRYLLKRMEEEKVIKNRGEYKFLFDKFAKKEFFRYLRNYSVVYLDYFIRGNMEMVWVIPALTFQHGKIFRGVPVIHPGNEEHINKRDIIPELSNGLLNLKFSYLDIKWYEWVIYINSIIVIFAVIFFLIFRKGYVRLGVGTGDLLFSMAIMGGMLFIPRALVPIWGQDFVILYWISVIIGVVMLIGYFDLDKLIWSVCIKGN